MNCLLEAPRSTRSSSSGRILVATLRIPPNNPLPEPENSVPYTTVPKDAPAEAVICAAQVITSARVSPIVMSPLAASVVKLPAARDAAPIATPSIEPPFMSAFVIVTAEAPPSVAPSIEPPLRSIVVTVPMSATVRLAFVQLLPIAKLEPSSAEIVSTAISPTFVMLPSEQLRLVPTSAANVPAAALLAPIGVPSIAPLSTLMFVIAWLLASRAAPSASA